MSDLILTDLIGREDLELSYMYIVHCTKDRQIKPNLPKGPFLVVAINSDEEDLVQVDYNLHLR